MSSADLHDPKGKIRIPIIKGTKGSAKFSKDGKYRYVLYREWGKGKRILWIGMNPSTADANVDDPTTRREIMFSKDWGYKIYIKCNVLDYRATNPSMLITNTDKPCSKDNIKHIMIEANKVDKIVLAYGILPRKLSDYPNKIINFLVNKGYDLYVLGLTKDGCPRHPLYLKKSSKLKKFSAKDI